MARGRVVDSDSAIYYTIWEGGVKTVTRDGIEFTIPLKLTPPKFAIGITGNSSVGTALQQLSLTRAPATQQVKLAL